MIANLSSFAKVAQTKADKAEKARQTLASLHYSNVYQFILAGIVGLLLLRNVALTIRTLLQSRRRLAQFSTSTSEKGSPETSSSSQHTLRQENFFFRSIGKVDAWGARPIGVRFLPADCTVFRLVMTTFICVINLAFCLTVDTHLHHPATVNSNVARAFSRRCGRVAVANYPILFALAGRNNIISLLTGRPLYIVNPHHRADDFFLQGFGYTDVRYYHKVLGSIAVIESVVHTLAYVGYYCVNLGVAALHEEYTELYFKMGIVAVVMMVVMALTGIKVFRHKFYEIFLILHVLGAAAVLFGSWYHRPIIYNWVYAAVAVWAFERVSRLARHFGTIFHHRIVLRAPILTAEAKVVHGAIILSVPFTGIWHPSQHVYISFWSPTLLSRPWLFGQSHPFSIANSRSSSSEDTQSLEFVLRIHKGLTKTLANHIVSRCKASGRETCDLAVSAEGPYGQTIDSSESENVLLVAGGSGITVVASTLEDAVHKVEQGLSFTKNVRLIWAIHHLDQARWIGDSLDSLRTRADSVGLNVQIDIYVTRPGEPEGNSAEGSRESTPGASRTDVDQVDEKPTGDVVGTSRASVHHGRPDVAGIMRETVSRSEGHVYIIACGPESLAEITNTTGHELASGALTVKIAKFEC
ncbi:hypothetical protein P7C70_g4442, partial [Phenoliferia sp. Uapishka_3]